MKNFKQMAWSWMKTVGITVRGMFLIFKVRYACGLLLFSLFLCIQSCKKTGNPTLTKFKSYKLSSQTLLNTVSTKTADGGYAICSYIGTNKGYFVMKLDGNGNLLWNKSLPVNYLERNYTAINVTTDNKIIVTGYNDSSYNAIYATCLNDLGDTLWDRSYIDSPGVIYNTVSCIMPDGNLIIYAGVLVGNGLSNNLNILFKIDQAGQLLAIKKIPFITGDTLCVPSAIQVDNNSIFITGFCNPSDITPLNHNFDFILSTDEDGGAGWVKYDLRYIGGTLFPEGMSLSVCPANKMLEISLLCNSRYYTNGQNIALTMLDQQTSQITDTATISFEKNCSGPLALATSDGGFLLAVTQNIFSNTPNSFSGILLMKMDAHFNVQWRQEYNMPDETANIFGLYPDGNNGYVLLSTVLSSDADGNSYNITFIRTDAYGKLVD